MGLRVRGVAGTEGSKMEDECALLCTTDFRERSDQWVGEIVGVGQWAILQERSEQCWPQAE